MACKNTILAGHSFVQLDHDLQLVKYILLLDHFKLLGHARILRQVTYCRQMQ